MNLNSLKEAELMTPEKAEAAIPETAGTQETAETAVTQETAETAAIPVTAVAVIQETAEIPEIPVKAVQTQSQEKVTDDRNNHQRNRRILLR